MSAYFQVRHAQEQSRLQPTLQGVKPFRSITYPSIAAIEGRIRRSGYRFYMPPRSVIEDQCRRVRVPQCRWAEFNITEE